MILKIIHSGLFLFVVCMGIKQGYAIINGETEMMKMFEDFSFNKTEILLFGIITLLSSILIFYPKTFLTGNILMATTILLLIFFQLHNLNIKGAFIEIPFLLMNIVLVYWKQKHPFSKVFLN
ncbi:hypothetical protein [Flavobacterium pectinovorum]|jgi:hypothetical protein|uniref:DoxX family protein n=1 Tax=Flavobacterium pectinovorum TaxID=29533 RepID=A0A502ES16_9FLAO|nr:hypothetical protein [Flavobacterium pectinovorum]TPG39290.1 hypothetical protein EAH81_13665 [Flavobacterium pectinovorum]